MEQMYTRAAGLLHAIGKIASFSGKQNYDGAIRCYRGEFLPGYQAVLTELLGNQDKWKEAGICPDGEAVVSVLGQMTSAQEQQDYLLLSDYLTLYVKPFLKEMLEAIRNRMDILSCQDFRKANGFLENKPDKGTDTAEEVLKLPACMPAEDWKRFQTALKKPAKSGWEYVPELTEEGPVTLLARRRGQSFYLHGNTNPRLEAELFAEEYGEEDVPGYAVLGLGLAYHALSLWKQTNGAQEVHVYEPDVEIIRLSYRYVNFRELAGRNFYIHYDPELKGLSGKAKEGCKLVVHAPSIRLIEEEGLQKAFHTFFIQESSHRNQGRLLASNFMRNIRTNVHPVEELAEEFAKKTVYIVAAGPSLDKNAAFLKKRKPDSVLLAVGTVFRKLANMDISPDYVIVTDPNERVTGQIQVSVEYAKTPLLLLSTAHFLFAENYPGEKYILFQKDFPKAEAYAGEHNRMLFETGGSVATTALDLAIRFRAKRIVFAGLDLAFTDNKAHASGTSNMTAADESHLHPVKGYGGGTVYSDFKFDLYRKWIEERVKKSDAVNIEIINATEGGSYIEGMKQAALLQTIGRNRQ